jgi:hypothetical protein
MKRRAIIALDSYASLTIMGRNTSHANRVMHNVESIEGDKSCEFTPWYLPFSCSVCEANVHVMLF